MAKNDLVEALNTFLDWEKPWTFYDVVLGRLSHSIDDQEEFERIWVEACRADHWQHSELARGCDACAHALARSFSWLPEVARAQIVRAASFQWK